MLAILRTHQSNTTLWLLFNFFPEKQQKIKYILGLVFISEISKTIIVLGS